MFVTGVGGGEGFGEIKAVLEDVFGDSNPSLFNSSTFWRRIEVVVVLVATAEERRTLAAEVVVEQQRMMVTGK